MTEINTEDRRYKSYRTTINDPILVSATEKVQRDTGLTDSEILKNSLTYLEQEGEIKLQ